MLFCVAPGIGSVGWVVLSLIADADAAEASIWKHRHCSTLKVSLLNGPISIFRRFRVTCRVGDWRG